MRSKLLAKASEGASKLVEFCLELQPGDDLLIITDERTIEVALLIQAAAVSKRISAGIVLVPIADQVRCQSSKDIVSPIKNAMRGVQAILTCVDNLPGAMRFRAAIIEEGKFYGTKIGNCPGIDATMLATALNVNYDRMVKQCNLVARTLIRGECAEVTTYDQQDRPHTLQLGLGRWKRVPVASTGIIPPGLWGNIPSGETYLAPLEGTANGKIVINGSVPGYVLPKGEEIILTFSAGALQSIDPQNSQGSVILLEQLQSARDAGDRGCAQLGELGIGLNPRVRRLTGKPLIDEKKAKTAHVALGKNTEFGGKNTSRVHLDLVTFCPTITVDKKPVLDKGLFVLNEKDWLEDYKQILVPPEKVAQASTVTRSGNEVNDNGQTGLKRVFIDDTGPGRTVSVSVGNSRTARLAARVYKKIPKVDKIPFGELVGLVQLDQQDVLQILWLMKDYEMVDLVDTNGERMS